MTLDSRSRRCIHDANSRAALSGVAVSLLPGLTRHAAAIESTVRGVRMGLITGSLNPLPENTGRDPIDVIIEQCLALGAANIELVTVFPQGAPQIVNGGRFGQPPLNGRRNSSSRDRRYGNGAWRCRWIASVRFERNSTRPV